MTVGIEKSRFLTPLMAFVSFISTVNAQGFSTGYGSGAEQELVRMANDWIFYAFEASSVADIVIFFVAPLFGYYMINKNIFTYGLESFENRLDRNNWHNTDDDLPTGLKGAALATAFITVQILGMLSSVFLLLSGGIAAIAWFMSQVGLIGDWSSRGSGSSSGGDSSGGSDKEPPQEIMDRLDDLENQISGGESAEDDAKKDEADGLPEDAVEDIEAALSHFDRGEDDIFEILKISESEVRDIKADMRSLKFSAGDAENKLNGLLKNIHNRLENWEGDSTPSGLTEDIENRLGSFPSGSYSSFNNILDQYAKDNIDKTAAHGAVQSVLSSASSGATSPSDFGSTPGTILIESDSDDMLAECKEVRSICELMEKFETSDELHGDVKEAVEIFHALDKIGRFLIELGDDLDTLRKEEDYLVEMINQAEDRDIADPGGGILGSIRSDRRKAESLKSHLQDLESRYKAIVDNELGDLYAAVESYLGVDEKDLKKIVDNDSAVGGHYGLLTNCVRLETVYHICGHSIYQNFGASGSKNNLDQSISHLNESKTSLDAVINALSSGDPPAQKLHDLHNDINTVRSNLS